LGRQGIKSEATEQMELLMVFVESEPWHLKKRQKEKKKQNKDKFRVKTQ